MNRRQAKILIQAVLQNKEIVLPQKHHHIRRLLVEEMVAAELHEIPFAEGKNIDVLLRLLVTGACDGKHIDGKMNVVFWKPTTKAKQWVKELTQSQRHKDINLLKECGYMDDDVFDTGEADDPNGPFATGIVVVKEN